MKGFFNMQNIIIRPEEYKDYRTVEELTRVAFNTPDRIVRSKMIVRWSIIWYISCGKKMA